MKYRYKLILFTTCFVMLFTISCVVFIANHMIQNRLDNAIENAVNETKQVVTMSKMVMNKSIPIKQMIYAHNRVGEQFEIVHDDSSETYYKLLRLNERYYIEVYTPIDFIEVHAPTDAIDGTIKGRFDVSDIVEEGNFLKNFIMVASVVILFVTVFMSALFSFKLTKNIRLLEHASKTISKGNYKHRVKINSKDEIGSLGDAFNEMAMETDKLIDRLNHVAEKNKKLYGALTHEISTPLTSIIGYSELMLSNEYDEEIYVKALNHIYREGKRLKDLSDNLLSLSNEALNRESVEMTPLIEESFVVCKNKHSKKVNFKLSGSLKVYVDVNLMRVLFSNLFNNSMEVISENGNIECIMNGNTLRIMDDGPGIVNEDLFEPFVKNNQDPHHLGLGLTLVKDIVNLHGDEIRLEPILNGTCFVIEFTTSLHDEDKILSSDTYDGYKEAIK